MALSLMQATQYNFTNFTLVSNDKVFLRKTSLLAPYAANNTNLFFKNPFGYMISHSLQIHVYVCTFLVLIGLLGNLISLMVFIRSARHSPKITTRHSFILLSISNLIYLLLFWYYSVMPRFLRYFKVDRTFANWLNQINTNRFMCKTVLYSLNASICINALITVSFSLERAFAVNFPLRARNMRGNHHCLFKIIFFCIILISFIFPIYNLLLLDLSTKPNSTVTSCDVPEKFSKLYFRLTLLFVIKTLAIPFLVITISNISIVIAIYKNKKLLDKHKKEKQTLSSQQPSIVELPLLKLNGKNDEYAVVYRNTFVKKKWCIRDQHCDELTSHVLPKSVSSFSNNSFSQRNFKMNNLFASFNSSNKSSNHSGSLILKNESLNKLYAQNNLRKHLMVTKMLVPISSSFVLLQLPYFISWCFLADSRLNYEEYKLETYKDHIHYYYNVVRLTEILNLSYYSIASFLLFSGKTYRKHLYALFCSMSQSPQSFKLQRELNNNVSKKIEIVRL